MKSIYKSEAGKRKIINLYDSQLEKLNMRYTDLYIDTSFGKTHLIESSALLVPAAIANAPVYKSVNMMFPMAMYWITHKKKWFKKCILPMSINEENISKDIMDTAKASIDFAKIKTGMPSNESDNNLLKYTNPVLVMAAERDCLFPGIGVINKVKRVWKQSETYLLKNRGHINNLTREEQEMLKNFLLK